MSCRCGGRFIDAEDFRDHLPCPGSPEDQAREQGRKEGIAAVIAVLKRGDVYTPGYASGFALESPEGQAAVAAELAKIGEGT